MKTLIITAHPASYGFTHKIAKRYEKIRNNLGSKVEIINLYNEKNHLDFLKFENIREDFPNNELIKSFQKKITESDELVFIFPMWNLTEPAILKNFIDVVFTARFAFKYETGKSIPIGLLGGKVANLFVTCDGPSFFYKIIGNPLKRTWKIGRMNTCSIKLKNFIYFDKMRLKNEKEREKYLDKVEKIARKTKI